MTQHRDLLVEIGTEELPPKALKKLMAAFASGIEDGLAKADLEFGTVRPYATPRRLAVHIETLITTQTDRLVERRGPALNAAFDDIGLPTKATEGFARSCGVAVEQLEKLETDKGTWLAFRATQPGCATKDLLTSIIEQSLAALPIPKRMRWGSSRVEFVRPVHWVVLLFGDEVVDAEILGVRTGRETRGHRFHHPAPMYLAEPAAYAPLLETEGRVMPDFAARREAIYGQVQEKAVSVGGTAVIDDALLDEVTALVEWPVALLGQFEERFLSVPQEALISTMKGNQKYFHVVDKAGKLLPYFITVCNIESRNPDQVRAGNERVIRPRLSDAAFFWEQDRKHPLFNRLEKLKSVVFEEKLGTLYDKTMRIKHLAGTIAEGAKLPLQPNAKASAEDAATLCKCDLLTHMVSEFPELQGVMGRYYAEHDDKDGQVAQAIEEHYLPRHAGDALPQNLYGQAVAIADRLDTLAGIFAIGQAPSGDKDPYGLRRAALGALRILIECRLDLHLTELIGVAAANLPCSINADVQKQLYDFMMERLRGYYHEQGIRPDIFEAVLAKDPSRPYDFDRRIHAVKAFRDLPEAERLAAANKRIVNILRTAKDAIPESVHEPLLSERAEHDLFRKITELRGEVTGRFECGNYEGAMKLLASLREPVDTFFDKVMVMVDDAALRSNRLALLKQLAELMNHVADISKLATA
ncbi:MAG: glycine--tRNA ligase subunit beta [Gammaproteobacteria bacterium]|nr:glycine--tRNA ligase subunit beta [Gammaproteobacteria bacterium]